MNKLKKMPILVVEDDEAILDQYQTLLEARYPVVFTAKSKQEGYDVFERQLKQNVYIPVVITDIQMETETAGIDLINKISSIQPATQFIIVSSLHEKAFVAIHTAKANIASMPKPVPVMHLRLAIESGFEKYREFQRLKELKQAFNS